MLSGLRPARRRRPGTALGTLLAALLAAPLLVRALRRRRHTLPPIPVAAAEPLVRALQAGELTVAAAESCSGGVLSALLTGVPGAGEVFRGGVVAYTEDLKQQLLDVPGRIIEEHGVVSDPVARSMAEGVRRRLNADVGLAVTGLIGSPKEGKPAGLVYVAAAGPDGAERCLELPENHGPEGNRKEAAGAVFTMAEEMVREWNDRR